MESRKEDNSSRVKEYLAVFDKVGIAPAEAFDDVVNDHSPEKLLPGFKSVIVYAKGSRSENPEDMGVFDDYLQTIAAQSQALDFLNEQGYRTFPVEGSNKDVSLVRMGMEAGLGEISPVDSLVVKGLGLTTSLGAIITDAPLEYDDPVSGICTKCMKCLKVCPIRDVPNGVGDLDQCGCGRCRDLCPV